MNIRVRVQSTGSVPVLTVQTDSTVGITKEHTNKEQKTKSTLNNTDHIIIPLRVFH
jgi:hypothetical protein